jgi:hypothetical protein
MCPVCMATFVLIAAGVPTTGGLAALAVKKLRAKADVTTRADSIKREEGPRRRGQTNQRGPA